MSDQVKPTPGPWRLEFGPTDEYADNVLVIDGTNEVVADPRCGPNRSASEILANARLIAATPRLVEELKRAIEAIETLPEDALGRHPEHGWPFRDELLHNLRAALREAGVE